MQEQPEQPEPGTQQEAPQQPQSALSQIQQDKNGHYQYETAPSPDVAWDGLVERNKGNVARAQEIADSQVRQKEAALKAAQKGKVKDADPDSMADAYDAKDDVVAQIQQSLDFWKQVAGTQQRRAEAEAARAAEEERQRKADEAAAAKKAQEEAEKAAAAAAEQTKKDIEDERKKQQEQQQEKSETEQSEQQQSPVQQTQSGDEASEVKENSEKKQLFDNTGNPIDKNGKLIIETVDSIDEITDEDFTNPTRTVRLPDIPANVDKIIQGNGKPVIIKKRIFKKNHDAHPDITPGQSREILKKALYTPDMVGKSQPKTRPTYWLTIKTGNKNSIIVLEVSETKDNIEIVGWRAISEKSFEKLKKQAGREGGQFLIQTSISQEDKDAAAALSTLPSDLLSEDKGTENSETSNSNSAYTVTPYDYTKKNGDVLHMYKVDFGRELTPEERQQLKPILSETRGWYDRNAGAYLMRSEEDAKRLGDALKPTETTTETETKEETKTEEPKKETKEETKNDTKESVVETANRIAAEERKKKFDAFVSDLEKRLSQFKGVNCRVIRSREELRTLDNEIPQLKDEKFVKEVNAFVHGGTVYFYAPNLFAQGMRRTSQIVAHEIVGHVGLKRLKGDQWPKFCQDIWDGMSDADRLEWIQYHWDYNLSASERGRILDALGLKYDKGNEKDKENKKDGTTWDAIGPVAQATILTEKNADLAKMIQGAMDEYAAHLAEKVEAGEELKGHEKSLWEKIVDFIRNLFSIDGKTENKAITEKDVAEALIKSRENLTGETAAAEAKGESLGQQVRAAGEETETKPAKTETKKETGKKETAKREVKHNEGHIDDYGEVLAGARKLLLGNIAEKMKNVDVKNLIALPLSKVFSRTDFFRQMQAGKISAEDALLLEAMQRTVYAEKKPSGQKRGTEREVQEWAERTYSVLDLFRQYCEAETDEQRRAIREKALSNNAVQAKDDYRLALLKMADPEKYKAEKEAQAKISPIKAMMDVLTGAGFPNRSVGAKITVPAISVTNYRHPFVVTLSANRNMAFATYEEARDMAVKVVKVQMGDTDIEYTTKDFRVVVGKTSFVPSGKFFVTIWKGARILSQTDFNSKEEAEAYIEEKVSKGVKRESMNITERRAARVDKYSLDMTDWPANQWVGLDDSPQFDSREEAKAWIADNIQELNERANAQMSEKYTKAAQSGPKIWDLLVSKGVGTDTWSVGYNPSGFLYVTVKDGFKSYGEAYDWAEANTVRVSEEINKIMAEVREMEKESHFNGERERKGTDWRKGKDVTAEQFGKKFGFRGVQFGNWTDQQDRQRALNEAYDAFMDLAELLHVSPEALSLAGELGIAFGARGSGWANAHYETDNVVINLTKTRGAGSLAHEWWHALDNYFSRQGGVSLGYVTDESGRNARVRDEVRAAYNGLMKAIEGSNFDKRSKARGPYWGSTIEETARLFGEWVNYRLEDQGRTNSFLSRGYPKRMFDKWERINLGRYRKTSGDNDITLEEFRKKGDSLAGCPYPTREETDKLSKPIEKLFDAIQERVEDGKTVLFSVSERNEATVANIGGQKEPGVTYETAGMDDLRFSVGKRRKEEMENRLKKARPDIGDEQRKALFDYLDTINDTKIENAAFHWFVNGSVRLPEDMDKIRQAVKVAGMAKVDPASYRSPMELIEAHSEAGTKEERINPDTVRTLTNKKEYPDGITVYDVEDSERGRKDMRKIIDTHLGEDRNPWCLLAKDPSTGEFYHESRGFWYEKYNKYQKRVAFRNGKLIAFFASDRKPIWWSVLDHPFDGIPVTKRMPGDELRRTATFPMNEETLEYGSPKEIHKGDKHDGVYEEWADDGKTMTEHSEWKDGNHEGREETWYDNGKKKSRSMWKGGEKVGLSESWYENGKLRNRSTPTENGHIWEGWYVNGQLEFHDTYNADNRPVESLNYYPSGLMKNRETYKDGKRTRIEEWYKNGEVESVRENSESGSKGFGSTEYWFDDGAKQSETSYHNGRIDGEARQWDRNGTLIRLSHYNDGDTVDDTAYWSNGRLRYSATYVDNRREGYYEERGVTGHVELAGEYRDGRKNGIWRESYSADSVHLVEYRNGVHDGPEIVLRRGVIVNAAKYDRGFLKDMSDEQAAQWLEKNGYEVERRQTDKGTDYYVKEKPEDDTLFSVSPREAREGAADDQGVRFRVGKRTAVSDYENSKTLQDVNQRFNEKLKTLTPANANDMVLNLGRPSIYLRSAGVEDKPMILRGNKIYKKVKKHSFSPMELSDLPNAMAHPVVVFKGSFPNSHAVLTEMKIGGLNALVSVRVGEGNDIDFNLITSDYGKDTLNVIRWMSDGKLLEYVDKQKALDFLRISAPIADAQRHQELLDATKEVKDFANSKLLNEKETELDKYLYEVMANDAFRLAPNTKKSDLYRKYGTSLWVSVRLKEFKDLFGDWENDPVHASKVLKNGEPLIVHNIVDQDVSNEPYEVFIGSSANFNDKHELFLVMNNPREVDAGGADINNIVYKGVVRSISDLANYAKQKGHDGLKISNVLIGENKHPTNVYIPFTDDQKINIPSSSNMGVENLFQNKGVTFSIRDESRLPSHALRQSMTQTARDMAEQLHLDNVEILTDTSSLSEDQMNSRGLYDPATGKITIVVPNHADSEDVAKTVLHEAVAHYGLRQMFAEGFSKFLRSVYENAPIEVRRRTHSRTGPLIILRHFVALKYEAGAVPVRVCEVRC